MERKKVYIFGAHSRGQTMAVYLTSLDLELGVAAYLVDNEEDNPSDIEGVPVIHPERVREEDRHAPVYLAIRGTYQASVKERLRNMGFSEVVPVTVSLDAEFRKRYFRHIYAAVNRPFRIIDDLIKRSGTEERRIRIYEVCSVYDKALEKDQYIRTVYESPIQVGTALTNVRIPSCRYFDNIGDNISEYNRQFCEETALYWMWKHAGEDIVGLVHYRRHFILPEDWTDRLISNDVDVILPIPLYVRASVEENYRFRHVSKDWDVLMDIIRERSQADYTVARQVFGGNMYVPLNMFIMKREVLNEYCGWLFPILFRVMERVGTHEDVYQNRYPAFMAERLLTLYFEMHREKYNIVYADKGFLQ